MPNTLLDSMTQEAARFLDGLDPIQRGRATRPFSDERERTEWYYTPNARPGIPMIELDAPQQQAVRRLLHTGLSEGGYNTAATIMGLEAILDPVERWRPGPFMAYDQAEKSIVRDPAMYFVCVFGNPGDERWGWSFGGHHVSVHYTVAGEELAASPCFFGAHPAVSPLQPGFFLEPLAAERKLGLELLHLLDSGQRARAIIAPNAPYDIASANRPRVTEGDAPMKPWEIMGIPPYQRRWETEFAHLPQDEASLEPFRISSAPKGLSGAEMTAPQRVALSELIAVYLKRMPDEAAHTHLERVSSDIARFHFAWAGGESWRPAHYYRIQGPRTLIEYDSPYDDGCHIHAVWRDPEGDFGYDILARHHAEAHR
jgi:hypothetical protein